MRTDLCAKALRLGRMLASLTPHDTDRIDQLGGTAGPYALQAAIGACHARARTAEDTDWVRMAALYDGLAQISPFPVVELNRGVAVAQAFGPQAGLDIVMPLFDVAELRRYHLCPRSPATCSAGPGSMIVRGSTSSRRHRWPGTHNHATPRGRVRRPARGREL
jgi:predicted RNA polymerase sigma factor